MPNRTEARPAKAALTNATGRLPLLRLFSTPLNDPLAAVLSEIAWFRQESSPTVWKWPTASRVR